MKPITALVTGVGAAVGMSVIKAIRAATLPVTVVGVDSEALAQGLFFADRAHRVPLLEPDPDAYFEALVRISLEEGAQILFSGWEGELRLLADRKQEYEARTGAVLPLAPEATKTALDKWLTVQALAASGVGVADSVLPDDTGALAAFCRRHRFPYVVKPRRGWGGQSIFIVHNEEELSWFVRYVPDALVQELLLPADQEYSVGLFLDESSKPAGAIPMRRVVKSGVSYRLESDGNPVAAATAEQAAASLGLIGPVNVQLRLTDAGPKVFEVNPRCSGSTCVRAQFGLNEPELAIRRFVLVEELPPVTPVEGYCLRYWEEMYLTSQAGLQALQRRYPASPG